MADEMAGNENEDFGDIDLYDELLISADSSERDLTTERLKELEDLRASSLSFKETVAQLESQNETLKRQNDILKKNISVLYKTAKLEISRKNGLLNDLQRRYDQLVFRRLNVSVGSSLNGSLDDTSNLNRDQTQLDRSTKANHTEMTFKSNSELAVVGSSRFSLQSDQWEKRKKDNINDVSKSNAKIVKNGLSACAMTSSTSVHKTIPVVPRKNVEMNQLVHDQESVVKYIGNHSTDISRVLGMVGITRKERKNEVNPTKELANKAQSAVIADHLNHQSDHASTKYKERLNNQELCATPQLSFSNDKNSTAKYGKRASDHISESRNTAKHFCSEKERLPNNSEEPRLSRTKTQDHKITSRSDIRKSPEKIRQSNNRFHNISRNIQSNDKYRYNVVENQSEGHLKKSPRKCNSHSNSSSHRNRVIDRASVGRSSSRSGEDRECDFVYNRCNQIVKDNVEEAEIDSSNVNRRNSFSKTSRRHEDGNAVYKHRHH